MRFKSLAIIASLAIFSSAAIFAQSSEAEKPTALSGDVTVDNPLAAKVPTDVILVKGAVPFSSDPAMPVPEGGSVQENHYVNKYFGISYSLPPGFFQKYLGPPPSDSGYYVLTQLEPKKEFQAAAAGSVLVSAQDLFFGLVPAENPLALVDFRRDKLGPDFKIERQPTQVTLGKHSFIRFDYMSPVAHLHWYTLTTEVRCHAVQFQFTSRDPELLESMIRQMARMGRPQASESGSPGEPVCLKNYATRENVLHRVDPVFTDRKFNPIPVRVIIDRYGKVKHVHVISGFPDQNKVIEDALTQWEFRPYRVNGEPVEVETGIMFGSKTMQRKTGPNSASLAD